MSGAPASASSSAGGGGDASAEPDLSRMEETIREAIFACSEPQLLKLPWEQPGLDLIFGKGPLDHVLPDGPSKIEYPVPSPVSAPVEEQARAAKKVKTAAFGKPCFLSCVNLKNQASDAELTASAWQRSLEKWHFLLSLDPSVSLVGSSIAGLGPAEGMQSLRELFGRKSEATVGKRAAALLKYVKYLQEHRPFLSPFPFTTAKADEYVRHLRSCHAKPGAVDAFTEAVRFGIHVVGIGCDGDPGKIFSPWAVGFRGFMQSKKPERVAAKVLSVEQVSCLEGLLDDLELDVKDRYACGAFLFCIYSRSRISDVKCVHSFVIDTVVSGSSVQGFLECGTRSHKTARQAAVQGVSMPLIAPVNGVTENAWGPRFVAVALTAGLPLTSERQGPLLPAPRDAGDWGERAVTSDKAGSWLRALLSRKHKCTDGVTGHSLKATTLDWCGKYGLQESEQTLLGHHALKGATMYSYMRDKLAAPLRSYEGMLSSVRKGLFLPDATRSGLFRVEASDSVPVEQGMAAASSQDHWSLVRPENTSPVTDGDSGQVGGEAPPPEESDAEGRHYQAAALTPEAAAEEFLSSLPGDFEEAVNDFTGHPSEAAQGSSSSSSSDSSTSGSEDGPDWSDAFQGSLGAGVQKASVGGPDFDFWRHDRTLTIHSIAAGSAGETFTCGRKKTGDYSKVAQSAFLETRLCSNCRKSKPVRDLGALNAILSKNLKR